MTKFFKLGLFSPKLRLNKIKDLSSFSQLNSEDGFTLVELIVVVMMIGILSSIAIPQFMTAADKAKQKEATGIVAALVKAATAFQTEYGALPQNAGDLEEYAKFQECVHPDRLDRGGAVCKDSTPEGLEPDAVSFFSTSGHYFIEFDGDTDNVFRVKANPNGAAYITNGAAVRGCYNPRTSVSEVVENSMKNTQDGTGKGVVDYRVPSC
tara:strand:- start:3014 stop:3640 length:627 start_codon:yes stop_codon:yes gene_type:complete